MCVCESLSLSYKVLKIISLWKLGYGIPHSSSGAQTHTPKAGEERSFSNYFRSVFSYLNTNSFGTLRYASILKCMCLYFITRWIWIKIPQWQMITKKVMKPHSYFQIQSMDVSSVLCINVKYIFRQCDDFCGICASLIPRSWENIQSHMMENTHLQIGKVLHIAQYFICGYLHAIAFYTSKEYTLYHNLCFNWNYLPVVCFMPNMHSRVFWNAVRNNSNNEPGNS